MMIRGRIVKAIGGFYYVESPDGTVYECKARGIFRKKGLSPLVGDTVVISLPKDGYPAIEEIDKRKNQLIRPPIANIDKLMIVTSIQDPSPNLFIIDKMIAVACNKNIEPVLIISKVDLADSAEIFNIYSAAGIKTIRFSMLSGEGIDEIKSELTCGINVFTGNTGVGKSTLLNCVYPNLSLKTGQISQKLGRGKHTTRLVELFEVSSGCYVADTPGFSTVDIERYELIDKDEIQYCFKEFNPFLLKCKFNSCTHRLEKGCAIIEAVCDGKISRSRHDSYVSMYNEVKDIKDWEKK